MDLKAIRDAFDHATKKQKLCSTKTKEILDQICIDVQNALTEIQNAGSEVDTKSIFSELNAKLTDLGALSKQEGNHKQLGIALSKYSKLLEKSFNTYISKAYRNVDFDIHALNHIIASHFYRERMFDIGDSFVDESKEPEAAAVKSQFLELYHILSAMTSRNLDPALAWASTNHEKLRDHGTDFVLKLHSLQFMEILRCSGRDEAFKYARKFLAPFATSHMSEVQKLMACLLWAHDLVHSPYADLLSPTYWESIGDEITKQFCTVLGQSCESHLSLTLAAGVQALPQLLKLENLVVEKRQDWQSIKELPIPLDLDKEFQFHSIFVCPTIYNQDVKEQHKKFQVPILPRASGLKVL